MTDLEFMRRAWPDGTTVPVGPDEIRLGQHLVDSGLMEPVSALKLTREGRERLYLLNEIHPNSKDD